MYNIVIGDVIARVGVKNPNEINMGHLGVGVRNKAGDRLLEFASQSNFKAENTLVCTFEKRIKKMDLDLI